MKMPTQAQIYAGLRYAGTAAGTIGTIAALAGVTDQQTMQNIVAAFHAVIVDLTNLFGDTSKLVLLVIPVATFWITKLGWNSARPANQTASAIAADPKGVIAAVQALPEAQVTVTDPKLASPGVTVAPKGTVS